jgi:hypothetical protein
MGHAIDLGSTLIDYDLENMDSPEEADAKALYSDWAAVGKDMRQAAGLLVK